MGAPINMSGRRFGRLVVSHYVYVDPKGWKCQCDCGRLTVVSGTNLRRGNTQSCGCLKAEKTTARNRSSATHGRAGSPEYRVWSQMKARCENPAVDAYMNYGARGIRVCERWSQFENFFADMGTRPSPKHSLEREDVNGHYEPHNCVWATRSDQNRNMRSNVMITFDGETMCASDWADRLKIPRQVVTWRIRKGWPAEQVLKKPVRSKR